MCSLFMIVYLIETSLWVRSLVPTTPAASPALCPDTEGEMASSVPFLKTVQLSKWQWHVHNASLGSSPLSVPPAPGTVSLPSLSSPSARPPAGRRTAPEPNPHVTDKWAPGYRFPTFSFHLASLCLSGFQSPQLQTQHWLKQKPFPCCISLRTWHHPPPDVIFQ